VRDRERKKEKKRGIVREVEEDNYSI